MGAIMDSFLLDPLLNDQKIDRLQFAKVHKNSCFLYDVALDLNSLPKVKMDDYLESFHFDLYFNY